MAKPATAANQTANQDYTGWETSALNNYNTDIGSYMSNVNGAIAAGNPYQSKDYLTNRNIATSGAMNSAKTSADAAIRDTALRTGTNTAAVAGERAKIAQQGQRDLTNYNATSDTQNEDKWLTQQQQLRQQQLEGATSEAGVFGTSASGRGNSLSNLTSAQNNQNDEWTKLGTAAIAERAPDSPQLTRRRRPCRHSLHTAPYPRKMRTKDSRPD